MISASRPVRQAAALGLLGVILLGCWFGFIVPLIGLWVGDVEADQSAIDRLARLDSLASRRPALERQLQFLIRTASDPAVIWSGPSPPVIAAGMQNQVRNMIAAAGGSVLSTTESPIVPEHGLLKVTLRVEARGTVETLLRTLHAVESVTPALVVDDLLVTAPEAGLAEQAQAPVLTIRLNVTGFGVGS